MVVVAKSDAVVDTAAAKRRRAIEVLSDRILASRLATVALQGWCRECGLADGPPSVRLAAGASPEPLDADSLRALGGDAAGTAFRRVEIRIGGLAVADAHNWYFPDRLTAEMRERLTTDCPFGEAVEALQPRRRTVLVRRAGPEVLVDAPPAARPSHVLEHRAVMELADGTPIALVHERFRAVLVW